MIIAVIGIIAFLLISNMAFYEYRVHKTLFKEPQYITNAYASLELKRKYTPRR